jgi:hypothetical protein
MRGLESRQKILPDTPEWLNQVKQNFLEKFESKTEGLNLEKVENFLKPFGFGHVDPTLFFEEDRDLVRQLLVKGGIRRSFESEDSKEAGVFIPELDLVLVKRDRELEAINGPSFTEGLLVHERAHASSKSKMVQNATGGVHVPRVGHGFPQRETPYGQFLEEGFADMLRGMYRGQNMSNELKELAKVVPSLDTCTPESLVSITNNASGYQYDIPLRYATFTASRTPNLPVPATAGYALELLCEKEPKLMPALLKGRTAVEGLRQVAQVIESIQPGLYPELQRLSYSEDDFALGMKKVKEVIG